MNMQFLNKSRSLTFSLVSALTMSLMACGGGGDSVSITGSGTDAGLMTNTVSTRSTALFGGQTTTVEAVVVMKGVAPNKMIWSVTPLTNVSPDDPVPTIDDALCANATLMAALTPQTTGQGYCQTVLSVPNGIKSGTWRITNTASSPLRGSVSHFTDISVTALSDTGFRIVEASVPLTSYTNSMVTLSLPYAVNPGIAVTNVKYRWADDAANPTATTLTGTTNATATAIPQGNGIYRFNLEVTADINGVTRTTSGSFTTLVYMKPEVNTISAGAPQIALINTAVSLTGEINNPDPTATYSLAWRQLDGLLGGPQRVLLSNVNTLVSGFVAPSTAGTYGFELSITKNRSDGTKSTVTTQTSVLVQAQVVAGK